jgi:hypothetical protein
MSAGGCPAEAMLTSTVSRSSPARTRRYAAVVKRVDPDRSSATFNVCRTVAGSASNIAVVRTVCRVSAVCEAASGPLPQTSPRTTPQLSGPIAKTS